MYIYHYSIYILIIEKPKGNIILIKVILPALFNILVYHWFLC